MAIASQLTFNTLKWPLIAAAMLAAAFMTVTSIANANHGDATTSTTVSCDETSLLYGTDLNCEVVVEDISDPAEDRAQPEGTVSLSSDIDGALGSCDLAADAAPDASSCAFLLDELTPGVHVFTATYAGGTSDEDDHAWLGSEDEFEVTVLGGTIVIEKVTLGGEGASNFTITGGAAFTLTTDEPGVAGLASEVRVDLVPGQFTVTEAAADGGWSLTAISCSTTPADDAGSEAVTSIEIRTAVIDVAAGETVTCRFENTQFSSLTIVKNVAGVDGSFAFAQENLAGNGFIITTAGGTGSKAFTDLLPGEYSVEEVVPMGWSLSLIGCVGETDSDITVGDTDVVVDLAAGEDIVCTFTNSQQGTISITKVTAGGNGSFNYTSDLPGGNFTLTTPGAAVHTVTAVPGQTYAVAELVPAGWTLTGISCEAVDGGAYTIGGTDAFVAGDTAVTVSISMGGVVNCTFVNTLIVEEEEDANACEGGPAAASIAAKYLKEQGIKGHKHGKIVSSVAKMTGKGAAFADISKCDREAYETAIQEFIDELLGNGGQSTQQLKDAELQAQKDKAHYKGHHHKGHHHKGLHGKKR